MNTKQTAIAIAIVAACSPAEYAPKKLTGNGVTSEMMGSIADGNSARLGAHRLSMNGIQLNGIQLNGIQLNGVDLNGLGYNGLNYNGLPNGVPVQVPQLPDGVEEMPTIAGAPAPGHALLISQGFRSAVAPDGAHIAYIAYDPIPVLDPATEVVASGHSIQVRDWLDSPTTLLVGGTPQLHTYSQALLISLRAAIEGAPDSHSADAYAAALLPPDARLVVDGRVYTGIFGTLTQADAAPAFSTVITPLWNPDWTGVPVVIEGTLPATPVYPKPVVFGFDDDESMEHTVYESCHTSFRDETGVLRYTAAQGCSDEDLRWGAARWGWMDHERLCRLVQIKQSEHRRFRNGANGKNDPAGNLRVYGDEGFRGLETEGRCSDRCSGEGAEFTCTSEYGQPPTWAVKVWLRPGQADPQPTPQ